MLEQSDTFKVVSAALACAFAAVVCFLGCDSDSAAGIEDYLPAPLLATEGLFKRDPALAPLPDSLPLDKSRVALGRRLFEETKLSVDGLVACATCHSRAHGGANGQARTELPGRESVKINVPSVFNLAFNSRFAWSGKFDDIGDQIDTALELPEAMNTTWADAKRRLSSTYGPAFAEVYREGLTEATMRDALSQYSLSLITPHSKFDEFLNGRAELSAAEHRGYVMFRDYGCVSCHQGINVGGNMFQRFGVMRDYFENRGTLSTADLGLYAKTKRPEDRHVFRVPSLRNVELTAPYFHDGSVWRLEQAVQVMARYQLGRELSESEAADIAAFLRTLTGKLQEDR